MMRSHFKSISCQMQGQILESSLRPGVMDKVPLFMSPSLGLHQGSQTAPDSKNLWDFLESSSTTMALNYSQVLNRAPKILTSWEIRNIKLLSKQDPTLLGSSEFPRYSNSSGFCCFSQKVTG